MQSVSKVLMQISKCLKGEGGGGVGKNLFYTKQTS